jgi:hypothetical protein
MGSRGSPSYVRFSGKDWLLLTGYQNSVFNAHYWNGTNWQTSYRLETVTETFVESCVVILSIVRSDLR